MFKGLLKGDNDIAKTLFDTGALDVIWKLHMPKFGIKGIFALTDSIIEYITNE